MALRALSRFFVRSALAPCRQSTRRKLRAGSAPAAVGVLAVLGGLGHILQGFPAARSLVEVGMSSSPPACPCRAWSLPALFSGVCRSQVKRVAFVSASSTLLDTVESALPS